MLRTVWAPILLAAIILLELLTPGSARAGFCSSTHCSLALTDSDFIGSGSFGTVTLTLSSGVVAVDVNLASPYRIVKTDFPGAIGFADNLGGGLTVDNFSTGDAPNWRGPGFKSASPGCTTPDCLWGSFGYANNAAATRGLPRTTGLQQLSFTVSNPGTSISDVRHLVQKFGESQRGPAYFVVDACLWDGKGRGCRTAGLFAVTQVPEPASLAIVASGLLVLGFLRWRRII